MQHWHAVLLCSCYACDAHTLRMLCLRRMQGQKAERYLQLAGELTNTCWQMYHRMPCGGWRGLPGLLEPCWCPTTPCPGLVKASDAG